MASFTRQALARRISSLFGCQPAQEPGKADWLAKAGCLIPGEATRLTPAQMVHIHAEGIARRGLGDFDDPAVVNKYRELLPRRGERWAASVLGRDLSKRSPAGGPWLYPAEAEILVLADQVENRQ